MAAVHQSVQQCSGKKYALYRRVLLPTSSDTMYPVTGRGKDAGQICGIHVTPLGGWAREAGTRDLTEV